jgi:hypothetical protein
VNCLLKPLPIIYLALGMGCGTLTTQTPEQVIGGRALEQAEALRVGDYKTALDFMTPSYRASPRAADYQRNRAGSGSWQKVDLKWVRCDEEYIACDVRLIVTTYRPPAVTFPIQIPIDDKWVKVDGQWYQYD